MTLWLVLNLDLPKPLQIHLCGNWEDFVKRALSNIYSQPGVTQEVPFATSLQILHGNFVDIPACKINNQSLWAISDSWVKYSSCPVNSTMQGVIPSCHATAWCSSDLQGRSVWSTGTCPPHPAQTLAFWGLWGGGAHFLPPYPAELSSPITSEMDLHHHHNLLKTARFVSDSLKL